MSSNTDFCLKWGCKEEETIKNCYKNSALKHHPDKAEGNVEIMKDLNKDRNNIRKEGNLDYVCPDIKKLLVDGYFDKLKVYFELKKNYDSLYNTIKRSIINNKLLTKKEKKSELRRIKVPCISCKIKSNKGTIFSYKDNTYSAKCGNISSPCSLDISIRRAEFINLNNSINDSETLLKDLETQIINVKLELLFNFITESEMIEDFTTLKEDYKDINEQLISLRQIIAEQTNIVERKNTVKVDKVELFETLELYKNTYSEYLATNNKTLLKECIELYIDDILPILESICVNENMVQYTEYEMIGKSKKNMIQLVKLIKVRNTIASQEIILNEPVINSFKL